jgi:hypothetical protein
MRVLDIVRGGCVWLVKRVACAFAVARERAIRVFAGVYVRPLGVAKAVVVMLGARCSALFINFLSSSSGGVLAEVADGR